MRKDKSESSEGPGTESEMVKDELPQPSQPKHSKTIDPNLVPIHADNKEPGQTYILFGFILAHIALVGLFSLALPEATLGKDNTQWKKQGCGGVFNPAGFDGSSELVCETFPTHYKTGLVMLDLHRLNQFAILYVYLTPQTANMPLKLTKNISYSIHHLTVSGPESNRSLSQRSSSETVYQEADWDSSALQKVGDGSSVRYRVQAAYIRQLQEWQGMFVGLAINELTKTQTNDSKPSALENVKNVEVEAVIVNEDYSEYSIAIRAIYFAISLTAGAFYIGRLKKLPNERVTVEQRTVMVCSVCLMLFNDPLYVLAILTPNYLTVYLSVVCVALFFVVLLYTWSTFLERINYEDGMHSTHLKRLYQTIYLAVLYVLVVALYLAYSTQHMENTPIFPGNEVYEVQYGALIVIIVLLSSLYLLYVLFLYLKALLQFKSKERRNRLFLLYNAFFIVLLSVLFFLGSFELYSYHPSRLLMLYASANLYIISLQYLYSVPFEEAKKLSCEKQEGERFILSEQLSEKASSELNPSRQSISEEQEDGSASARRRRKRKTDRIKKELKASEEQPKSLQNSPHQQSKDRVNESSQLEPESRKQEERRVQFPSSEPEVGAEGEDQTEAQEKMKEYQSSLILSREPSMAQEQEPSKEKSKYMPSNIIHQNVGDESLTSENNDSEQQHI